MSTDVAITPDDVELKQQTGKRAAAFGLTWVAYASYYFGRKGFGVVKSTLEEKFGIGVGSLRHGVELFVVMSPLYDGPIAPGTHVLGMRIDPNHLKVGTYSMGLKLFANGVRVDTLHDALRFGVVEAGAARDWQRFHTLFHPELGRLMPVGPASKEPGAAIGVRALTPAQYVERATPLFAERGFYESEVARKVERFGHIAQVFSTYESRKEEADEKPFARGINSIQLMKDQERWWVVSIFWCEENPTRPIPGEYLPK